MINSGFLPILIALGLYGLLHSLVASLGAKQLAREVIGGKSDRWYRLGFSIFAVFTFIPVLALYLLMPDQVLYRLTFPGNLLFYVIQGMGFIIFIWSLAATDLWAFIGLKQISADPQSAEYLTTSGPYRLVRHPMYTGSLMILWFNPVMSLNLLALNLGITAYFMIGSYFEEKKLLRQFGADYARYQRQTPMLIPLPRLSRLKD